jgi:hypothetical protein
MTNEFEAHPDARQIGGTHYLEMEIQPWDVMRSILTREEWLGFIKGNVIKYSMRQGRKDSDDARKARHYMDLLRKEQNEYL